MENKCSIFPCSRLAASCDLKTEDVKATRINTFRWSRANLEDGHLPPALSLDLDPSYIPKLFTVDVWQKLVSWKFYGTGVHHLLLPCGRVLYKKEPLRLCVCGVCVWRVYMCIVLSRCEWVACGVFVTYRICLIYIIYGIVWYV